MATNESDFKREFRKALEKHYQDRAVIWTNNDMFRCGLPDFSAHYDSRFFAIEAKYVKAPPARPSSKVLGHELTTVQAEFLNRVHKTGGHSVVLIGFSDIAVAVPFQEWSYQDHIPDTNITLERVRLLKGANLGFPKRNGVWEIGQFFENIASKRISP